jgi:hypothetical protein
MFTRRTLLATLATLLSARTAQAASLTPGKPKKKHQRTHNASKTKARGKAASL